MSTARRFTHGHLRLVHTLHHAMRAAALVGTVLLVLRLVPGSPGWIVPTVPVCLGVLPIINLALMVPAWAGWIPQPLSSRPCWSWFVSTQNLILAAGLTNSVIESVLSGKGWGAATAQAVITASFVVLMRRSVRNTDKHQARVLGQKPGVGGMSEREYVVGAARRREEHLPGFDPDRRVVSWS